MTTLTDAQIAKMRRNIGDSNPDNAGIYDLTDADIQLAYDDASDDWWVTAVDLLEQRLGLWVNEIDTITLEGSGQSRNQKYKNIMALLEYARQRAGIDVSRLTIGSLDENLSADEPT